MNGICTIIYCGYCVDGAVSRRRLRKKEKFDYGTVYVSEEDGVKFKIINEYADAVNRNLVFYEKGVRKEQSARRHQPAGKFPHFRLTANGFSRSSTLPMYIETGAKVTMGFMSEDNGKDGIRPKTQLLRANVPVSFA